MLPKKISFAVLLACCISLFFVGYGKAQTQVYGTIKDTRGKELAQVSVSLKNSRGYVLRFKQSDAGGRYVLSLPDTPGIALLWIEVNLLGYKKMQQQLIKGQEAYNFLMDDQAIVLKEIKIKPKPRIISIGDTLSYDVASFSRPEDRSIGDVIRRLPGVSVAENGQISYNGKTISNLFIHGDDLMDGRYGLATKVIKKEMIKSVDVMQHHQPVKVLKDKVLTDAVAMNLVLKDENSLKLGAQVVLGGGLPGQFDGAINTMVFNKRFKMLNSLQANNSGLDYRNDFAQLGTSGLLRNINNTKPSALLSIGAPGNPDLPKNNYYFNRSGLFNANNLYNLKGGLQLKTNIQTFIDRNTLNYNRQIANYLQGDTIRYNELQSALSKARELHTAFTATVNKNSYFLNNKFSFDFSNDFINSSINLNGDAFNQNLNGHTYSFSNDFNFTPALKNKNIMNVRWFFSRYSVPQTLRIFAGLNQDVLNNGLPYAAVSQYASIPTFFNYATVSYRINNKHLIKQNYQFVLLNEHQKLNSDLNLTRLDGTVMDYTGDVGNNLTWKRDRMMLNADYSLTKDKWESSLSIPLITQSTHYQQKDYQLSAEKKHLFVNPSASIKYFVNAEDYISANYSFNNSMGTISEVYRGVILTNYRSLHANSAGLQEQYASSSGLFYNFQRSIIMLFINAGINYQKIKANSILSTELTENIQRTVLLPYKNDQSVLSANAGISKYLIGLNSTVSLKSSWNSARFNQFINNEQLSFLNNSFSLNANIESKFFGKITFSYAGTGLWNTSKQVVQKAASAHLDNQTKKFDQNIALGFTPGTRLFVILKGRQIYSRQADLSTINYLFLDSKIRYKFLKWRTDLEFDLTNMLNIKTYEVFGLSSNQFSVSSYQLRGRMGILRATFIL